jgi:methylmalonyl-CoA/ethylmalonyl-CoA epimerase
MATHLWKRLTERKPARSIDLIHSMDQPFDSGGAMAGKETINPRSLRLDLGREKIVQISQVVEDVEKVASRFAEIFGTSWQLYDFAPARVVLHDQDIGEPDCRLKIAIGTFGGRCLKLIQPVSGQSSYVEFLEKHGEGFYTVSLGTLPNHNQVVSALSKSGVSIEMQGDLGNESVFTILDTTEDMGFRLEISSPATEPGKNHIKQIGKIIPSSEALVDMDQPVFSGGIKVNQVGIVLKDEKRAAKRFKELLGIGGWEYAYGPPGLINSKLNDEPLPESEVQSLDVAFAMGWLGDIQIELIRPIGIRPGGCHQRFLDKHGNGIQHLSFGVQPDYAAVVDGMKKAGIAAEFSTTIKDHGVSVTYFASQNQLGGFQLEVVGKSQI